MDYQLKGKLAFLTAGANGIGAAIANLLTREGASVIVADQDEDTLRDSGRAWRATCAADLSTLEGIDKAVAHVLRTFGRAPDSLIKNLGVADPIPFEDLSDERWTRSMNVNLMGAVRTCRALLPRMKELGAAAVVNIGSDLAKQPEPVPLDYGLFKMGILHLTKSLAKAYVPHVRVNAVSAGPVWTDCSRALAESPIGSPSNSACIARPRCRKSWRTATCLSVSASRPTWRTQSYFWPRRWRHSSPAPISISAEHCEVCSDS
jgi:NAD(P)-dependent dehydrogenase (short-subunit alcohol dehydrogenase family)